MAITSRLIVRLAGSLGFRLACNYAMLWMLLWAEARAAPHLPDAVLDLVPYVPWVERYNYIIWLMAYMPVALWLLWKDSERFIRYMISAGLIALIRGICIVVTGLGPVRGEDLHVGMDFETRVSAFLNLLTPFGFFNPGGGGRLSLTKDLFFSGHTATTVLLLLYVWRYPRARVVMLIAHVLVVVSVFFAHLHYTIDVIGAYAITLALFALREGQLGVHPRQ